MCRLYGMTNVLDWLTISYIEAKWKWECGYQIDVALFYKAMPLVRFLNWCHDSSSKMWVFREDNGREESGGFPMDSDYIQGPLRLHISFNLEFFIFVG